MPKLTDPSILEVTTLSDFDLVHNVDVSDLTDPDGTSKKIKAINLSKALNGLIGIIPVTTASDLPSAILGVRQLEAKRYLFADFIDIGTDSLRGDPSGNTRLEFVTLNSGISYSGTGSMFVGDSGSLVIREGVFIAPNGSYFDFDNSLECYIFNSIFLSSANASNIKCNVFVTKFTSFYDFGDGFIFNDRTDGQFRTQVILSETGFSFSKNNSTTILDFQGSKIPSIFFERSSSEIQTNEVLFNFSEDLKINNTQIVVRGATLLATLQGSIFATNSLDEKYIYATFNGNLGDIPNSVTSAKFAFIGNSQETTITAIGTATKIATNVDIIPSSLSRILMQDVATLNFTTDIFTTTFNHGLANNDRVFLKAYTAGDSGTLPPELNETTEYFVINTAANTFQLSLTQGGGAINFSTNGTGIIHYRHNTGVSRSFQFIYNGIEPVTLSLKGWLGLINTQNSFDDMKGSIHKIGLDGSITLAQIGSPANTNNARLDSSSVMDTITLASGEGLNIRISNDDALNDITARQFLFNIN
jgi:hypothetical protein